MGLESELVYREQPISRLRFSKPLVFSLGASWLDPDIMPSFTNSSKGINGECGGAYMASLKL